MGRKSNYFRHSFEAHNDDKILELMDEGGLKSLGFYFLFLEIYGRAFQDSDDGELMVNLHVRRIASATRLRSDSARTHLELLAKCELIDLVRYKSDASTVQVEVPNFVKYYGSFQKAPTIKSPNKRKEKENKEKKRKGNKTKVNSEFDIELIYKSYPLKKGKKFGIGKLEKIINSEEIFNQVLKAVNNYIAEIKVLNTEQKYIKHFSTFVNNWEDYADNNWTPPESHASPAQRKWDEGMAMLEEVQREIDCE